STVHYSAGQVFMAWMPYLLLVIFVLAWGEPSFKAGLDRFSDRLMPGFLPHATALNGINVPGLHNLITRIPPVTAAPAPYAAVFAWNWLTASGTAGLRAALLAAAFLGVGPSRFLGAYKATFIQLQKPMLTIASMLGLAYLM